jgi:hypothetical protein
MARRDEKLPPPPSASIIGMVPANSRYSCVHKIMMEKWIEFTLR